MLTVRYDAQIFAIQRVGGISRYFTELIGQYASHPALGVRPTRGSRLMTSGLRGPGHRGVLGTSVQALAKLSMWTPNRMDRADLVHHTYYAPSGLRRHDDTPCVTTIHDMIPELMPEYFRWGNPHLAKAHYAASCDGLIFVSNTTKRDFERWYGVPDQPTAVVPLAPSSLFRPSASVEPDPTRVLFVGARAGYKSFDTLLCALSHLRERPSLVAVGGGALTPEERDRIASLGLTDRVRQVDLSDTALAAAYRSALALVAPSNYEGFGLPVVEAMASGCPVIASRIDVVEEVADEAVEYFRVGDPHSLAAALERMQGDAALRARRRREGLQRAKDYSWPTTARLTSRLYRAVVRNATRPIGAVAGGATSGVNP